MVKFSHEEYSTSDYVGLWNRLSDVGTSQQNCTYVSDSKVNCKYDENGKIKDINFKVDCDRISNTKNPTYFGTNDGNGMVKWTNSGDWIRPGIYVIN